MALASVEEIVMGSIAFTIFSVLAVAPSLPILPIGRTAGALASAVLTVLFGVMSPEEAYSAINLPILSLLFGTMLVSVYLERAEVFKYLATLLTLKCKGPKDLLCRISLLSAISSAFFTNDTCCVVLTEFVLKIAKQRNLPPHPFLLAVASSANIGSAATPIGNPQNLVIAVQSKIPFGTFVLCLFPAMLAGVLINTAILMLMNWNLLNPDEQDEAVGPDVDSHRFSPATMSRFSSAISQEQNVVDNHEEASSCNRIRRWRRMAWKPSVYAVTLGMLGAFIIGLNMSWTAMVAALALVVLDFKDARPSLEKVSYPLLLFFCGMFITVEGFNKTGIAAALWGKVKRHADMKRASGRAILGVTILVLSNVASNVPTVLLLGRDVANESNDEERAWLILAWVSTVAGNLSLLGSAANLIVCEQARRCSFFEYNLTFWKHFQFGMPSTLLVTAVGLTIIH